MKMSVEEEVELRDLLAQTLELNGCLPKIRAQLRANLFLTLDEDTKINKRQPLLNTKIKTHLEAPEGQLMFCLVREFLEYFDLDFTASVYDPESYVGSFYKYEGRQKIIEDLGLKSAEDGISGPLLLHVVKIAQTQSKTLKINLRNINEDQQKESNVSSLQSSIHEQMNGHSLSDKNSIRSEDGRENNDNINQNPLNATFVKKDVENDDTFNGTSSIEDETVNGIDNNDFLKKNEEEAVTSPDQDTSPESKSRSKSDKLKTKLDLPPLQLNKARGSDLLPSLYKKSNKDYDFEIKDDYEEDFMSGSELEFSQSKIDSPKPLFEELQQSDRTSNPASVPLKNVKSSSDNKFVNSSSTDIETNLSVDNSET